MQPSWIALQSIPGGGKTLLLDDQDLWRKPLEEFGIACRIVEPVRTEIFILPQEQGVLFRGVLTGLVALPCDRCADDSLIPLRHAFDSFEPYPADPAVGGGRNFAGKEASCKKKDRKSREAEEAAEYSDADAAVIRLAAQGLGLEINPGALAWEEFSLALPTKPLCRANCKGLCPTCGCNRNHESCACTAGEDDPRLAGLRGLNIPKK